MKNNEKSNNREFEIIKREVLYQGFSRIARYTVSHELFVGGMSHPYLREIYERYDAVVVLPYDPKLDNVVLIEEFRVGALRDKNSPWLLELVAGIIDKDKTETEVAHLEVKEEAGLDIISLIPVYNYWSSPGATSEYISFFCGIVDSSQASGVHGLAQENEDIKVHAVPRQQAFELVKSGRINNAAAIMGLQWLELNWQSLVNKSSAD